MSGQRMAAPGAQRISWAIQDQMQQQLKPKKMASPSAYRQPEEQSDESYSYDYEYSTDGSYYYDEEEGSYSYYDYYDESEEEDDNEAGEEANKEKGAAGEAVASDGGDAPAAEAPPAEADAPPAAAAAAEAAAPAAAAAPPAGEGEAVTDADGKAIKATKLCDHCRKNKRKAVVTMANGRQLKLCEDCVRKQIKKAGAPEMEDDMMNALKEAKKNQMNEPLSPRGTSGPTVGGLTSGKLDTGTLKRKKHQGKVKLADGPIADVSRIQFASKPKRQAPQPPKEALERARKRREEKAKAKAEAEAKAAAAAE